MELTPSPGFRLRQAFDSVMARGEPAVHFRAARSFNRERPERIEATRECGESWEKMDCLHAPIRVVLASSLIWPVCLNIDES